MLSVDSNASRGVGRTMSSGIGIFEELYQQIAAEPVVNTAWLSEDDVATKKRLSHALKDGNDDNDNDGNTLDRSSRSAFSYNIIVQTTQRDFSRDTKTKLLTELRMVDDGSRVEFERRSVFPQALGDDVKDMAVSPSGTLRCILRDRVSAEGKKKTEFEFWSHVALVCAVDVTDLHGKVMLRNDQFGHITWSADECFVAYCAERIHSKAEKDDPAFNKCVRACMRACVRACVLAGQLASGGYACLPACFDCSNGFPKCCTFCVLGVVALTLVRAV